MLICKLLIIFESCNWLYMYTFSFFYICIYLIYIYLPVHNEKGKIIMLPSNKTRTETILLNISILFNTFSKICIFTKR